MGEVVLKVSEKKSLIPLRIKSWSLASTELQNGKEAWFSIH
jgi:hypothetical protein